MSWISIGNLRRFTDKLFHSALTFDGSVTHNGADEFNGGVKVNTKPLEINGGVKVNTTKAEFNAPVAFTGTTTYKGNELATKADVSSGGSNITVDAALSDTSTNPVQNKVIKEALGNVLNTSSTTTEGHVLNHITWEDGQRLVVWRDEDTTKGTVTVFLPGEIYCGTGAEDEESYPFIDIVADINDNCIVSKSGSSNGERTLLFGEKLRYGSNDTGDLDEVAMISNGHLVINGSELWIE